MAKENLKNYWESVYKDDNLFLSSQMQNDRMTWRLKNKKGDKLLLKGLLEDPTINYNINNNFQAHNSIIGTLTGKLNEFAKSGQIMGAYARSAKHIAKNKLGINGLPENHPLNKGLDKVSGAISKGSDLVGKLLDDIPPELAGTFKDFVSGVDEIARGHVVSPDDFVKLFNGTNVSLTTPQLTTVIWDNSQTGDSDNYTVKQVLQVLNDWFMGDMYDVNGIIGFQKAPNDYKPNFEKLGEGAWTNDEEDGTFRLEIGDLMVLKNILVTQFEAKLSVIQVTDEDGNALHRSPLYAEVTANLDLSAMIDKNVINNHLLQE